MHTPSQAFLPVDRFLHFPVSTFYPHVPLPILPSHFCTRYPPSLPPTLNGFCIFLQSRTKPPGNTFQGLCIRLFSKHISRLCIYFFKTCFFCIKTTRFQILLIFKMVKVNLIIKNKLNSKLKINQISSK